MALERLERLTTSTATAERTWLGEVRPRLSGMAELAKGSQIEDALARLAGLHESCAEIKRHVEQQLQAVAQVQAALAELSKSDSVHHAEQKSHLERLAER
jgi:gamma-glutamylcysteine synthetase